MSARIDDVTDLLKICLYMMTFIEANGLWDKFSEYSRDRMNEEGNK